MGFASTWLVSQVGGRLLGHINECFVVVLVVVELVDVLDIPVYLVKLLQHGIELFVSEALSARKSTVVIQPLLGQSSTNRLTKCRWVEDRCSSSSTHQVLVDVRVVATQRQRIKGTMMN